MKGVFITFEGTEGSGKTTIIEKLYEELNKKGYPVIKTREPGGSKISEQIRNVILNCENTKMDSVTEALLYAASRRQHLIEVVIPHIEKGDIVLCDRYVDSSLAYQGYARKIGIDEVYQVNQFAISGLLPDLTIYIDVHPEIGLKRIKDNHRDQNRLDLEKQNFHNQVYEGYSKVEAMFKDRFVNIDGERTIEEVFNDVLTKVLEFLGNKYEL